MSDFTANGGQGDFRFVERNGQFAITERNGSFAWKDDYDHEPMLDPFNIFVGKIISFYCRQTHD